MSGIPRIALKKATITPGAESQGDPSPFQSCVLAIYGQQHSERRRKRKEQEASHYAEHREAVHGSGLR